MLQIYNNNRFQFIYKEKLTYYLWRNFRVRSVILTKIMTIGGKIVHLKTTKKLLKL